MTNKILPSATLVEHAKKNIEVIYPFFAKKKHVGENTFFVDIRDIREIWKEGKLKDAFHAPRGMLEFWVDPLSPYYKKFFTLNNSYILYCASGWRSALATYTLKQMGYKNVFSLEGGFANWKKCMLPVVHIDKE